MGSMHRECTKGVENILHFILDLTGRNSRHKELHQYQHLRPDNLLERKGKGKEGEGKTSLRVILFEFDRHRKDSLIFLLLSNTHLMSSNSPQ